MQVGPTKTREQG